MQDGNTGKNIPGLLTIPVFFVKIKPIKPIKKVGIKEATRLKLSTRSRYGLLAIIDMAMHQEKGHVPLREIASRQNLSENYLEHLVGAMRRAGLIQSVRGPSGGYYLARTPAEISLGEIIRVLEGPIAPVECSHLDDENCFSNTDCFIRNFWEELRVEVNRVFDSKTLKDLMDRAKSFKSISGCLSQD